VLSYDQWNIFEQIYTNIYVYSMHAYISAMYINVYIYSVHANVSAIYRQTEGKRMKQSNNLQEW